MAKGRRLTNSRSERLLGTTSFNNYGHIGHVPVPYSGDVSEFAEEDIWSMVEHVPDHNQHNNHGSGEYDYVDAWTPRAAQETGRRDRVSNQSKAVHVGGLSLAFEDETTSSRRIVHQFGTGANNGGNGGGHRGGRHVVASSAPVNVPDWSKILRVDSAESMFDSYEDDQVDESGMEPPHEYLARSRKMDTFSVYEGVGRTLKGRDMSRVRDAVWSQTGFEG